MSVNEILEQRGSRYGEFRMNAALSQTLKRVMAGQAGWQSLSADQAEALEVIAKKIARILNGDPDYDDNWIDIAEYATLVSDRLKKEVPSKRIAVFSDDLIKPTYPPARALLAKIRTGEIVDGFTEREIYLKGWIHLGEVEVVKASTALLSDLGYLIPRTKSPGRAGGRPSTRYFTNVAALKGWDK